MPATELQHPRHVPKQNKYQAPLRTSRLLWLTAPSTPQSSQQSLPSDKAGDTTHTWVFLLSWAWLHTNSPTALTPRLNKSLCLPSVVWKDQTAKAPSEDFSMSAEMNNDVLGEQRRRWMNQTLISALSLACESQTKHVMVMMKIKYCRLTLIEPLL